MPELIRRVRGTKALGFADGLMGGSRRGATLVVRTSVQSITNEARFQTFKKNKSVVKGYQAVVTFDNLTSDICIARSGFAWDHDGKPMNARTTESFPGPPPWHRNCRTTLIPIVKSYDELIKDPHQAAQVKAALEKVPVGVRASMNGAVAKDLTYDQWLRGQTATIQKKVLGVGKHRLWKNGDLSLRDLIDQSGRPLTLAQLQKAG